MDFFLNPIILVHTMPQQDRRRQQIIKTAEAFELFCKKRFLAFHVMKKNIVYTNKIKKRCFHTPENRIIPMNER